MLSPRLLASTPFGNYTALLDLAGSLELYLHAIAQGRDFSVWPVGTPGGPEWLLGVDQGLRAAGEALDVEIPDLSSYDLKDEGDWASWTFTLSNTLEALRVAAGIA